MGPGDRGEGQAYCDSPVVWEREKVAPAGHAGGGAGAGKDGSG